MNDQNLLKQFLFDLLNGIGIDNADEVSTDVADKIFRNAVLRLGADTKSKIGSDEIFTPTANIEELTQVIKKYWKEDEIQTHLEESIRVMLQDFLQEIGKDLNDEQKQKLIMLGYEYRDRARS
ncbi:hypothetical protein C4561_03205 [candidate division WWE3 bacterium]|jgi:uncharacterized protein YpuA (DUF1002 family)|uniref:Uncharacterized protein n=1 Tax=candidate division WWE3 bacterium TaxID=2053526 RepID=A0A3A4ZD39_UNCKA|nr:MAG: hypothetical protein C4561_03205 [candidate division WWE3 bacterium]